MVVELKGSKMWSTSHLHEAKKRFDCNYCDQPILPGDWYYRWKWPNKPTVRVHARHRFES